MKVTLIALLGILIFFSIEIKAQNTSKKVKVHKVWILKVDNSKDIKGVLFEANDSFLRIIDKNNSETIVNVKDINKIKIRRKGKIGNSAAIGALTGIATGALIGFVSGDDPVKKGSIDWGSWGERHYTNEGLKAGDKAIILGVSLGATGSIVGAIIGTKKEIFLINGDIEKYQSHFDKIQSYSMSRKHIIKEL
jgi:hypothetical protein